MNKRHDLGFTVIELAVVIVILCVLGTLVAVTYSGVQANNRNNERQADIDILQSQLEAFYAQHDVYPSLAQINDSAWRAENLKNLKENALQDPQWAAGKGCANQQKAVLANTPTANCYAYQITAADGAACDNNQVKCGRYTLTVLLENGEAYVKASLN